MNEKPILFSAPMMRATLDGSKTQTRRILKPQPIFAGGIAGGVLSNGLAVIYPEYLGGPGGHHFKSRWIVGDRLWVRETWQSLVCYDHLKPSDIPVGSDVQYPATYDGWVSRRRPAIHMPRWASRISLTVTDIRVQRLQDISEEDALAEGAIRMVRDDEKFYESDRGTFLCGFAGIWGHINGFGSWDANPWVAAITFERNAT